MSNPQTSAFRAGPHWDWSPAQLKDFIAGLESQQRAGEQIPSAHVAHAHSLLTMWQGDEVYRFGTGGCMGSGLDVQIIRTGNQVELTAESERWEYMSPKETSAKTLTAEEWHRLRAALDKSFWGVPQPEWRVGCDGWTWSFLGRRGDEIHRYSAWCPDDPGIIALGNLFSELAGLDIPEDYP